MKPSTILDYDTVLRHLGQFGPWQRKIFAWLWLSSAAGGLAVVVWAFTAFSMNSRCLVPYCESSTDASYFASTTTTTGSSDNTLPNFVLNKNGCKFMAVKRLDSEMVSCEEYLRLGNESLEERECAKEDMVFDNSVVRSSVLKEYGLFCDRWIEGSILGTTYMLGMLFGSFTIGLISDHFGRLKALMLSIILTSVAGFAGAFATGPLTFGILRFLTGIGGVGTFMVSFVLVVEFVGAKYTMLVGIAIEIPFALGELLLGMEAYFVRDWAMLQMVAYGPLILLLLLYFVIPESPRWLLAVGRKEEAVAIIREGARANGRSIPEDLLTKGTLKKEDDYGLHQQQKQPTFLDIFRPLPIALRSFNMFYQWFSVTLCYYGLSLASTSLPGDTYSNFCLSILTEIPASLFVILVMDCWGRRPILSFCQILSGASCVLAALLPSELGALQVILSLLGKFGATASFSIVYLYAAELYPTVLRNTAVGSCSTMARFGGILALLIQQLRTFWTPMPMVIMGVSAVLAGCLAVFFPETAGKKLPETMEEAIRLGDDKRGLCTCICPRNLKEMFAEE